MEFRRVGTRAFAGVERAHLRELAGVPAKLCTSTSKSAAPGMSLFAVVVTARHETIVRKASIDTTTTGAEQPGGNRAAERHVRASSLQSRCRSRRRRKGPASRR